MLEVIYQFNPDEIRWLRAQLAPLDRFLQVDVSSYAPDRQRYWLMQEYDLKNGTLKPAIEPSNELWKYLQQICQLAGVTPDLGLVAKGSAGINLHRDARYADYKAVSIQIGMSYWQYDCQYPGYSYSRSVNPPNVQTYLLADSAVCFNCKNPHGATPIQANRYSINLWRLK